MWIAWVVAIVLLDGLFVFAVWSVLPSALYQISLLVMLGSVLCIVFPLISEIVYRNSLKKRILSYLDTHEPTLLEKLPEYLQTPLEKYTTESEKIAAQVRHEKIATDAFASYIASWTHEIKKPVSLLQLLAENRKEEMSETVHKRLQYANTQIRVDIDRKCTLCDLTL